MLAPVRVTPPASAILTIAEVKANLRVDHADEDPLIEGLIAAATAYLDSWSGVLGRALIEQAWRQDFPAFGPILRLPLAPLVSVDAVIYRDRDDVEVTIDPGTYLVHEDVLGPYLRPRHGRSWPVTAIRDDAVSVTATYGYGQRSTDVPAAIRTAVLMLVGHLYEHREAVVVGASPSTMPMGVEALCAPYRRVF